MRPGGTGVGELWLGAGQQSICQSGNVEGRFTHFGQGPGERLPLIITQAGRAEIKFVAEYVEGGSAGLGIVYIDATPTTRLTSREPGPAPSCSVPGPGLV
jgi:hypothetical protein